MRGLSVPRSILQERKPERNRASGRLHRGCHAQVEEGGATPGGGVFEPAHGGADVVSRHSQP